MKTPLLIVLLCLAPFAMAVAAVGAGFVYGMATLKPRKPEIVIRYVPRSPERQRDPSDSP